MESPPPRWQPSLLPGPLPWAARGKARAAGGRSRAWPCPPSTGSRRAGRTGRGMERAIPSAGVAATPAAARERAGRGRELCARAIPAAPRGAVVSERGRAPGTRGATPVPVWPSTHAWATRRRRLRRRGRRLDPRSRIGCGRGRDSPRGPPRAGTDGVRLTTYVLVGSGRQRRAAAMIPPTTMASSDRREEEAAHGQRIAANGGAAALSRTCPHGHGGGHQRPRLIAGGAP